MTQYGEARPLDIGFWFPRPERGARLAQELRTLGHEVTIYHSLPVAGDQTHVLRVNYGPWSGLPALRRLDHEVFYTPHAYTPVLQLLLNKWLRRKPYLFTLNGPGWTYHSERRSPVPFFPQKERIYDKLLAAAIGGAGEIVANSQFLARAITKRYSASSDKISAIYNGIDYEAVDNAAPAPEAWGSGEPRILSVLTLNFEGKTRGAFLLLDAFETIARKHPGATYLIAAKSENPALIQALEAYRRNLSSAAQVRIAINQTNVPSLLAAADLFLYATPPDSSDSLPRALIEAQAAGVPTVTTDTVGCPEVVLHNETGIVVPNESEALADAALRLLSDSSLASTMAIRGRDSVRDRFNWQVMARTYADTFARIVGSS